MGFAGPTTPGLQQQQPQQGQGSDPQITYNDPMAYIAWLRSKRMDPITIDRMVTERFGPGQTPEERARAEAKASQMQGLGQLGGSLAGIYGMSKLGGLLGGGSAAAGGATGAGTVATPTLVGAKLVPGAAAAPSAGLAGIGSVALPVALAAAGASNAWETGFKDIIRGRGTREDYINQGVNVLFGGAPNIISRMFFGGTSIGERMTSGKSKAQKLRDYFRGDLKEAGLVDENYNLTLAGGEKFNIGKDGKTRYTNVDGKTTRQAWDVDFGNPLAKYATDVIDPIVRAKYANQQGLPVEQLTGMFVNAVTSGAKDPAQVQANIKAALGQFAPDKLPQYKGGALPQPEKKEPEISKKPLDLRQNLEKNMRK